MNRVVPAIFDSGVFRPLEPVALAEGTHVEVQLPQTPAMHCETSPEILDRQRAAIDEMIAEIEAMPIEGRDDGFSGRDHDKVLYGKP
jgi:predicted DNA-binding antitoxin AbrB/MazE fold protein